MINLLCRFTPLNSTGSALPALPSKPVPYVELTMNGDWYGLMGLVLLNCTFNGTHIPTWINSSSNSGVCPTGYVWLKNRIKSNLYVEMILIRLSLCVPYRQLYNWWIIYSVQGYNDNTCFNGQEILCWDKQLLVCLLVNRCKNMVAFEVFKCYRLSSKQISKWHRMHIPQKIAELRFVSVIDRSSSWIRRVLIIRESYFYCGAYLYITPSLVHRNRSTSVSPQRWNWAIYWII